MTQPIADTEQQEVASQERPKWAPAPWSVCGASRGGCSCGQVWCPDYPVAIVTRGVWGDGVDLRRLARELWDHFRHKGFGFFAYGEVRDECAKANARLIAASPAMAEELRWIAVFADMRSRDDSKTFARVNRAALRTIAERARKALAAARGEATP